MVLQKYLAIGNNIRHCLFSDIFQLSTFT